MLGVLQFPSSPLLKRDTWRHSNACYSIGQLAHWRLHEESLQHILWILVQGWILCAITIGPSIVRQSRQKRHSSLNFALIKNVSNYGSIIFSILRGLCFLTFLIQAKLSKLGNFNSSPTQNKVFFPWPSVLARWCDQVTLKCLLTLFTILVPVSCAVQFKQLIIYTNECI